MRTRLLAQLANCIAKTWEPAAGCRGTDLPTDEAEFEELQDQSILELVSGEGWDDHLGPVVGILPVRTTLVSSLAQRSIERTVRSAQRARCGKTTSRFCPVASTIQPHRLPDLTRQQVSGGLLRRMRLSRKVVVRSPFCVESVVSFDGLPYSLMQFSVLFNLILTCGVVMPLFPTIVVPFGLLRVASSSLSIGVTGASDRACVPSSMTPKMGSDGAQTLVGLLVSVLFARASSISWWCAVHFFILVVFRATPRRRSCGGSRVRV